MSNDAAVAAIKYALETDEGLTFLRLWLYGQFSEIRKEWEDVPDAVFIGTDPLFVAPSPELKEMLEYSRETGNAFIHIPKLEGK